MGNKNRFYVDIMSMHQEVTGSCNLVVVKFLNEETIRFIVDCGLFQEEKYNHLNNELSFNPENLDFCLVTHDHVDHIGRLPYIVKKGFDKKIYLTKDSAKLLPIALKDSCKVLRDTARRQNVKSLYEEIDVNKTLDLMYPCDFNQPITINDNVKITFFNNGHLLGAAIILVQISYCGYEDINLLFTGDYNNKNIFFEVSPLPKWVLELPLTVIQESTYGAMDKNEITETFRSNIQKCMNNNGEVVSLVFSLGRSQEILYELKKMQEEKIIGSEIPIYFDGKLAIIYTKLYLTKDIGIDPKMKDFLPENLTFVDDELRWKLLSDHSTKIIVTTSGMGTYGPAPQYLMEYIKRENDLIQFTGYTPEGTLGYTMKNAEKGDKIQIKGALVKKSANVQYTTEFSAHAKADEMIEFLNQFKKLNLVLVNHGNEEVKRAFAERILDEVQTKNVAVMNKQYFFRINSYGLVKVLSTKFE